ncbi:right-handed parallel beta-helix repeat-containing protein [Oscillatoria amoena NRMC-F 0135]|nr:right-handed parallel beta-helix repeat-containing protein [Oscillatoria amoena NRMC-F 0135]
MLIDGRSAAFEIGANLHVVDCASRDPAELTHRTISSALGQAEPGDTILIRSGIYRERIAPHRSGQADAPIRLIAEKPGEVIVRGSFPITEGWQRHPRSGSVWRLPLDEIPVVQHGNPFRTLAKRLSKRFVLGQVFDGDVLLRQLPIGSVLSSPGTWTVRPEEDVLEVCLEPGTLPSDGRVEITCLDRLLAPVHRGLGYIEVLGITFERCANQFPSGFWLAEPKEDSGSPQAGAVSTRSGHHWRICHCVIRHANAIGLDCGGEGGHDPEGEEPHPDGDFSKPVTCGYHHIAANTISDNGACGIAAAGSRGTRIVGNRIERNNAVGWTAPETAGIKVHFFFDGLIADNLVLQNDAHGIWLDNQWYGTRVTRNVVVGCSSGVFVEMGDGPCLVDHNVVAYCGDGVYMHDSSGVTVAHNLLYCNRHFGVYARVVGGAKRRKAVGADGKTALVTCDRLRIVNNVLLDNYRGHVCLPPEGPRSRSIVCDYNLLLNGTQWHWEGQQFHTFAVTNNDGLEDLAELCDQIEQIDEAVPPRVEGMRMTTPSISLKAWRELLGRDVHSHASSLSSGDVEGGAVEKGQVSLSQMGLWLKLAQGEAWRIHEVPGIDGLTADFFGNAIPRTAAMPGPFQRISAGEQLINLAEAFHRARVGVGAGVSASDTGSQLGSVPSRTGATTRPVRAGEREGAQ